MLCQCTEYNLKFIMWLWSNEREPFTVMTKSALRFRSRASSLRCGLSFSGGFSLLEVISTLICWVLGCVSMDLPIDFNTAETTVWPQSQIQWRNDFLFFQVPLRKMSAAVSRLDRWAVLNTLTENHRRLWGAFTGSFLSRERQHRQHGGQKVGRGVTYIQHY